MCVWFQKYNTYDTYARALVLIAYFLPFAAEILKIISCSNQLVARWFVPLFCHRGTLFRTSKFINRNQKWPALFDIVKGLRSSPPCTFIFPPTAVILYTHAPLLPRPENLAPSEGDNFPGREHVSPTELGTRFIHFHATLTGPRRAVLLEAAG
jgi:hypothetical protein